MFKSLLTLAVIGMATTAYAEDVPISGVVESKCSVYTTTQGVYGQSLPNKLSTATADGGVSPKIRYDVAQAGYYIARIEIPIAFSSSPSLTDNVEWSGDVEVAEVTDPQMSAFETDKLTYNNVTEFDLTVAGTVWFKVSSQALYGYDKSYPAGRYTAIVRADCIAK